MLNLILKGQSTIMTNIFQGSIFFHFYISVCSSLPIYYVLVGLFLLQQWKLCWILNQASFFSTGSEHLNSLPSFNSKFS